MSISMDRLRFVEKFFNELRHEAWWCLFLESSRVRNNEPTFPERFHIKKVIFLLIFINFPIQFPARSVIIHMFIKFCKTILS